MDPRPSKVKTYVIVRSDQYLSLLAFVGAGALKNVFQWDIFIYLEIVAFAYVLMTFIRDWKSLWLTFHAAEEEDLN